MLHKLKLHGIPVGIFCDSIVNIQKAHFFLQNDPFLNELASHDTMSYNVAPDSDTHITATQTHTQMGPILLPQPLMQEVVKNSSQWTGILAKHCNTAHFSVTSSKYLAQDNAVTVPVNGDFPYKPGQSADKFRTKSDTTAFPRSGSRLETALTRYLLVL